MGRVTSSVGLSSGFPIVDTVNQLMAVSARPREQLEAQSKVITNQKNAYNQLTALTVGLQLTATRLGSASLYNQRTATSSDPSLLTARVNDSASPALGQYSFTPVQTAQSQQLQSTRFASKTEAVGAGSFSFRFGGFVDSSVSLDEIGSGAGFSRGKIRITDRTGTSADIDLTYARTIDDVLSAINDNGTIGVRAEAVGDALRLIDETGDSAANLRVQEVAGGTTAASLGLASINVAANQAAGSDIFGLFSELSLSRINDGRGVNFDEALADLKVTFRDGSDATLDLRKLEVTGSKASATTPGTEGTNSIVKFRAVKGGSAYDGVVVRFVNNSTLTKGAETVTYDDSNPSLKTLTFQVREGQTTARDVMNALNNNDAANDYFTASLPSGSSGSGLISTDDTVVTSGGAAVEPVPGGNETTIGDIVDALNALEPTKLQAAISADGWRIELTDLTTDLGNAFGVVDLNGSTVAADLGLTNSAAADSITGNRLIGGLKSPLLRSLNGGAGLGTLGLLDLTDRSGATASVNLSSAETIDDVREAINAAGLGIRADINAARNGIELSDTTGLTASNLIIANGDGFNTADKLRLTSNAAADSKSSGSLHLAALGRSTLLSSFYGGAGISQGSFTITDTNGVKKTISINDSVKTVGDVIDAIKDQGLALDVRINDAGDGITLIDTAHGSGTLTVAELGGTTAKSLRLTNAVATADIGGQPTQVIDGSTTFDIAFSATDTLEDIVKKVNNLDVGVSASIINDGSPVKPYRLTLYNQRTGSASSLLVDNTSASFSFAETVAARDALLAVGDVAGGSGFLAASQDNTFREAVPDVTLTVQGASSSPVSVSIDSTTESLQTQAKAFVDSYNKLIDKIDEVTAYDSEADKAAILQGDGTVLRMQADIGSLFSGRILNAGPIQSLEIIGITLRQDGTLSLDSTKLTSKFAEASDDVKKFFTQPSYGLSARVSALGERLAGVGNSLLIGRTMALDSKQTSLQGRIDFYTAKLEREREHMLQKFYAMDAAISKIQSNTGFLSTLQQIAASASSFKIS
jgi:flagellar hook-associated protein 2